MTLRTTRLTLREMTRDDFDAVAAMLQDPFVMYAWGYTLSDREVLEWIDRRRQGYARYGHDYWLALDRQGKAVGQIGLLHERLGGVECEGLGWMLCADETGKGYATEAGRACLTYAFGLPVARVVADIRPENTASIRVAKRLGMRPAGTVVKTVKGVDMPHVVYSIEKETYQEVKA